MSARTRILSAALSLLVASVTGCATITNGTDEHVHIYSDPSGADVTIDSGDRVATPAEVNLSRGQPHTLVFHKNGYQDVATTLTSSESGKVLGNVLFGAFIGVGIDEANGAAKELSTDNVEMTLTPIPTQASPPPSVAANDHPAIGSSVQPTMQTQTVAPPAQPSPLSGQPVMAPPQTKSE